MTSTAGCAGRRMCRRLGCSSQAQALGACRCSISLRARPAAVRGVIGTGSLRQTTVRYSSDTSASGFHARRCQLRAHFLWYPSRLLPGIALPEIDRWMGRRERLKVTRRCMQSEKGRSAGEPKETFSPAGIHPYNLRHRCVALTGTHWRCNFGPPYLQQNPLYDLMCGGVAIHLLALLRL